MNLSILIVTKKWFESFMEEFGKPFIYIDLYPSLAQVVNNSSYWLKRGGVPDERLELT